MKYPSAAYDLFSNNCSQFTLRTLAEVDNLNRYALTAAAREIVPENGMKILKERVISETLLRDTKNYLKLTFMETRLQ